MCLVMVDLAAQVGALGSGGLYERAKLPYCSFILRDLGNLKLAFELEKMPRGQRVFVPKPSALMAIMMHGFGSLGAVT